MDSASSVRDLYLYAYPLLLMDMTRQQMAAVSSPADSQEPFGRFIHARALPGVTCAPTGHPNLDTLFSSASVDLHEGPAVLSLPNTHGRYYWMSICDAWSNVVAALGARTSGTAAVNVALTGPGWVGELPRGMRNIGVPTANAWIAGRIQTNGEDDYPYVHSLQDRVGLTPLSGWMGGGHPSPKGTVGLPAGSQPTPTDLMCQMKAERVWTRFSELLLRNPPVPDDAPMVARLEAYGIEPGRLLDWAALDAGQQSLLTRAVVDGRRAVEELERNPPFETRNTWVIAFDVGRFGVNYAQRAATARMGLGADLPQDTGASLGRVDHEGKPLTGKHDYIMHFDHDELPPVRAFWSLTLYDERGCFAINPMERFAVDGRDPLVYENDGSLDLYIQYEHPGPERGANWLPAPAGSFTLILRLYWPSDSVLDGTWVPPRVTRVG